MSWGLFMWSELQSGHQGRSWDERAPGKQNNYSKNPQVRTKLHCLRSSRVACVPGTTEQRTIVVGYTL